MQFGRFAGCGGEEVVVSAIGAIDFVAMDFNPL